MPIKFDQFKFYNMNGIPAHINLEAPIGTTIIDLDVNPNSDATVPPFSVQEIESLKLTVTTDRDHPVDIETIDFNKSAMPYRVCVTAFTARSGIGRIEGEVSLAFGS